MPRTSSTPTTIIAASGSTISRSSGRSSPGPARLPERHYDAAAHIAAHEPAARARHAGAPASPSRAGGSARRCASSSPGASRRATSTGPSATSPDGADPRPADAELDELLRDAVGRLDSPAPARRCARWDDARRRATLAFRDGLFGSTLPAEVKDAASATLALLRTATVHPARRRRALGLGGPAHPGRLLRGLLHPCLELPAGAVAPLPGARADAARDRVHLQPAAHRRAHLPPEAAARLRLRHHRPLRRRPFRRDHQDLPRLEAVGRHRLAAPLLAERQARAMEYAWSPENPDRWDPRGDRHPLRPPAPDPRHGAVRAEFLARLDVCRGAARRRRRWRRRSARRDFADKTADAWPRPAPPTSTTSSSTAAGSSRRSTSATRRCSTPFDTGRNAGVLADGFMETYWSDEFGELKYQMGEGCISDQILGQWHAEVAGLGGFLDATNVRTALKAVHDNNFRADLADHFNPCRNYAYRGRGRPARSPPTRWASASRWSPRPTPRRSGPASSTCRPRT